jgi:hypothetical protein
MAHPTSKGAGLGGFRNVTNTRADVGSPRFEIQLGGAAEITALMHCGLLGGILVDCNMLALSNTQIAAKPWAMSRRTAAGIRSAVARDDRIAV